MQKRILKASPRGFCYGVNNAVNMLRDTLSRESGTVYVRKEIVHNTVLLERFRTLGAVFVDEIDEIPAGGVVVFSAHGVPPHVREQAKERNLRVVDATCPLVTKVHNEAIRLREQGYTIILIGEEDHKEVIGVFGEAPDNTHIIRSETDIDKLTGIDGARVAWLSQTTLNVDETQKTVECLRKKYPAIIGPPESDICYATKERQLAVKNIANECDLFIVAGSENSSNTNRLAEVALMAGASDVVRIDMPEELDGRDFSSVGTIGITSGVSVENDQLESIIAYLKEIGYTHIEEIAVS